MSDEMELFTRMPEHIYKDIHRVTKDKISAKRRVLGEYVDKANAEWSRRKAEPPFCRLLDTVSFTCGVLGLILTCTLIGHSTTAMVTWYTVCVPVLLIARFFLYSKDGLQYFLLDFCYFAQMIIFVFLYTLHPSLFLDIFAFAAPLALAIALWRNSLVFHSLDKMTSSTIHMLPLVLTYQLRWFPGTYYSPSIPLTMSSAALIRPILWYLLWQVLYMIRTESVWFRVSKVKRGTVSIAEDESAMTSLKWLFTRPPFPWMNRIIELCPSRALRTLCLVTLQFFYTVLSMCLTPFLYRSFTLHTVFLALITVVNVYNGANFYVQVFTSKYTHRVRPPSQ